jgi:hypothetical protein
MNTLLLRTLELKKSPSVQTFAQYREAESQNCKHSSVTSDGELLEHQTLELRVHPPNVRAHVGACRTPLACASVQYGSRQVQRPRPSRLRHACATARALAATHHSQGRAMAPVRRAARPQQARLV